MASGEDSSITSGLPADVAAITLRPDAASLAPWQPVVQRRQASARVISTTSDGAILQLADRRGASGFVVLRAGLASRSRATARADLIVARQRLAPGDVRSFIEIGAANGTAYQAGAVRGAGGMAWGVWLRRPDGSRTATSVSRIRVVPGDERRVQLETTWLSSKSTAKLQIGGREVAATEPVDLANVGPNRVNIGLGRPALMNEVGAIFVRAALAYSGAGASAVPATAPAPGGPGVVIPVVGSPGSVAGGPGSPVPSGVDQIPGREIARADWEPGTANPYFQRVADDRIRAVAAPAAEGKFAGRFEVREGDNPVCCGSRAEMLVSTGEKEGDERWYTWATLFDDSFPTNNGWQTVTQWHSDSDGVPPMGFYAENGVYYLRTTDGNSSGSGIRRLWETKLQKNHWYRIKIHVKWSGNASVGFVEMWVDGQLVLPKTFTRNMYPGQGNYFKQGYYRQFGIGGTGVVYHDGFRATQVN
jgi:Polysaccharide lyase